MKNKKPYLQGALDGLCAVYGIVNAARIINKINEEESQQFFNKIILYLEEKDLLAKSLLEGISLSIVGSILKDVASDKITNRSMPFKGKSICSLDNFWSELISFLNEKNRAVLMAINGSSWNHWSVVSHITDTSIYFFDSIKLKKFLRNRCTIGKVTVRRPHLLCTSHTYFLSNEGYKDDSY
jgi:hypothetical protein